MKGLKSALLTLAAPLAIAGCEGHSPPGYNASKLEDRQAITSLMTDFACRCAQFGPEGDFSDIKERAVTLAPHINSQLEEEVGPHHIFTLSAVGKLNSALWSNVPYSMTCGPNSMLEAKDPCTSYAADISKAVSNVTCSQLSDLSWTSNNDSGCDGVGP